MAIRIKADVTSQRSIESAIRDMKMLAVGYVEPASSYLITGPVAEDVRDRMAELVHDESDNEWNDGTLRGLIEEAQIEFVSIDKARICIRQPLGPTGMYGDTNPRIEKEWKGNNGSTPPPHDFTRENQAAASESAQRHWNEEVRAMMR